VARLTPKTLSAIEAPAPPTFPPAFLDRNPIDSTLLGVDDRIDVMIWESAEAGVFNAAGGMTQITSAAIDPAGTLFVPFAGPQRAAGLTLAQLRERISDALASITLEPQVELRLAEPRSRLISVQGAVTSPGIYPIERATTRLAPMLASAGGATQIPETVEITVLRGSVAGRQLLNDVLETPALNIALRPGDQIVLSPIRERFIVLGASGAQAEITFPTRPLDLLSALGAARGLRDFDADPTGIFIFRFETPAVADALLDGPPPAGVPVGPGRPIVYRLDLSQPEGLFMARRFAMRDGDAIFVTNAPLTELRKFLQLFNSVIAPVNSVNTLPVQ
jgi:polysaccharide export outer membrane protein